MARNTNAPAGSGRSGRGEDVEAEAHRIVAQAEALAAYLAKPGNRGAAWWFDTKDFAPRDRARILLALEDAAEAPAGRQRPA